MNHCALSPLFSLLGKKWVPHILATFAEKKQISFGDLRREFPMVTATTITARLRDFLSAELIIKNNEGHYKATEKLLQLSKIIEKIDTLGTI